MILHRALGVVNARTWACLERVWNDVMRTMTIGCVVLVMLQSGAAAWAGDLNAGNARVNLLGPVVFDAPNGDAAITTDSGAPDQLYKYCWYYRSEADPQPQTRLFSALVSPMQSYVGDTATIVWPNNGPGTSDAGGRFDAALVVKLIDGPVGGAARVSSEMRIKNINSTTRTFRIYHLLDLDLAGGGANPSSDDSVMISTTNPPAARYSEASTASFAEVVAPGANRFTVNQGLAVRTLLNGNRGTVDLNNAAGPYVGDGASAFEWIVSLAPNQEVTLTTAFGINMAAIVPPACRADFNGDGQPMVQDVFDFLIACFAGLPSANVNGDAGVSIQDIFDYLDSFFGGCP